jgi:sugar-specific transcriptional regulator TrmB
MSNAEEDRSVLEKLGLTAVQSRVYIANFEIGPATAKQISKVARLAREDIYRVIPALQTLGLIQKHITRPAIFEALPPKDAVTFLINHRKQETEKICKEAKKFLSVCKRENKNSKSIAKSEETILISNPKATFRRLTYEYERTKHTVDCTINWETHKFGIIKLTDLLNRVFKRGVKFRSVMDKPTEEITRLPKSAQHFFDHPSYRIRYIFNPPKCRVTIFDGERGFVFTSLDVNATRSPSLWTNNPILVSLMKVYFQILWDSAKDSLSRTVWMRRKNGGD